mgnify:FL=1
MFYILKVIANKTEIESKTIYFSKKNIFTSSIICLLYLTLVVFGLRGTFVLKNWPITISNAGKYTNNPNEISLIINTPFSLIRTYNLKDLKRKKYFKDSDLEKYTNIVKLYKSEKETKKNRSK